MARSSKRKHVTPTGGKASQPTKRQRKAPQIFEQGVNPVPLSPPPTALRPQRSREPTRQRDRQTPSPLFEPAQASQLATDAHAADILGEDEDEEPEIDATADDNEQVEGGGGVETRGAVSELPAENPAGGSPSVAAAATAAQSNQRQQTESRAQIIDEEPHLHWRYRACWGTMEKSAIASAYGFKRRKPLFTVSEDSVWRWADGVVETQKPRVSKIESLTATLYYTSGSRQAKADRCTIALQRSRHVTGEGVVVGNWVDLRKSLLKWIRRALRL